LPFHREELLSKKENHPILFIRNNQEDNPLTNVCQIYITCPQGKSVQPDFCFIKKDLVMFQFFMDISQKVMHEETALVFSVNKYYPFMKGGKT